MAIIEKIIQEQIPCFFISPHLDDAILSAGGLISNLAKKTKVTVVTVFTTANKSPHTRFAKKYMKICGYENADTYFADRKKEDQQILNSIDVNVRNLDFIDAAYRKRDSLNRVLTYATKIIPELVHLYPFNSSLRSGKIVKEDKEMISNIKKTINNYQLTINNFTVFCPLSIGNHVDHIIIRDICTEIFPPENIIFWTDYPYINWGNTAKDFIKKIGLKSFVWNKNLEKKRELILGYKTQIPAIFPKGLPENLPEVYYLKS